MSGSPKTASVCLSPAELKRQEAARLIRAAAIAAEQERQVILVRRKRVEDLRHEVGDGCRQRLAVLNSWQNGQNPAMSGAYGNVESEVRAVRKELDEIALMAGRCEKEELLRKYQVRLKLMDSQLDELRAKALLKKKAAEAAKRNAEAKEVLTGKARDWLGWLSTLVIGEGVRFDPQGCDVLTASMDALKQSLNGGDITAINELLQKTEKQARVHQETVAGKKEVWLQNKMIAETALHELDGLMAACAIDGAVDRLKNDDWEEIVQVKTALKALLERGEFSSVIEQVDKLQIRVAKICRDVEELEAARKNRNFIVEQVQKAIQDQFVYIEIEPQAGAEGGTKITAYNYKASSVEVTVPLQGDLRFTVHGYEFVEQQSPTGAIKSCDGAEAVIDGVRGKLSELGVDMGELIWDGKDPDRLSKTAKDLPGSEPVKYKTRGGEAV